MTQKPVHNPAPMFYQQPHTRPQAMAWPKKAQRWLYEKRIQHLQQRIDAIEEALHYELKQNYPISQQQILISHAKNMCLTLAHKQQRLLQKI